MKPSMKNSFLILFICFLVSCGPFKSTFLDENGNTLTSNEFQERWREDDNNLIRWDYKTDTGRVATLQKPRYSRYTVSHPIFTEKLVEITGKTFPENTIFLLEFTFLDDLCSEDSSNVWNKQKIAVRKKFLDPRKEEIEKRNKEIVILNFFEEGVFLTNSPDSPEEYFFMDRENFLRDNLFKTQTLCGSLALIKPNGQALVRNGEYTARDFEQHLRPENWELFFPPAE